MQDKSDSPDDYCSGDVNEGSGCGSDFLGDCYGEGDGDSHGEDLADGEGH